MYLFRFLLCYVHCLHIVSLVVSYCYVSVSLSFCVMFIAYHVCLSFPTVCKSALLMGCGGKKGLSKIVCFLGTAMES